MSAPRLRVIPTIAFEPDEGQRLRHAAGEASRDTAAGASRPHQPWRQDLYDLQMRAKVAVMLVEETFRNIKALEEIHETSLEIGVEELAFQVHELRRTAELLQPN